MDGTKYFPPVEKRRTEIGIGNIAYIDACAFFLLITENVCSI